MTTPAQTRHATVSCPFCSTLNRVDVSRLDHGPRCASCSRPLLFDRPQGIPGDALDRIVAETDVPVLVDFYADWCGPCRVMAPVLDQFAGEHAGDVLTVKLDTDRYPEVAARFGIRGIPTLIAFSSGREVARQVGAVGRSGVEALLEAAGATLKVSSE